MAFKVEAAGPSLVHFLRVMMIYPILFVFSYMYYMQGQLYTRMYLNLTMHVHKFHITFFHSLDFNNCLAKNPTAFF